MVERRRTTTHTPSTNDMVAEGSGNIGRELMQIAGEETGRNSPVEESGDVGPEIMDLADNEVAGKLAEVDDRKRKAAIMRKRRRPPPLMKSRGALWGRAPFAYQKLIIFEDDKVGISLG